VTQPATPLTDSNGDPIPAIPARDPRGHKGTFGTVAVFGGCAHPPMVMLGAPVLAATAAIRAGCGLARLVVPAPLSHSALVLAPHCTVQPIACDSDHTFAPSEAARSVDHAAASARVLLVGPGLGVSEGASALTLRAIQQDNHIVILDADAINALATIPEVSRDFRSAAILTPHIGEFRRLASALNLPTDCELPEQREHAAIAMAQRLGCVVVLKGSATVIADALRSFTLDDPEPALGVGGSGDVLAGIIAGLASQYVKLDDAGPLAALRAQHAARAGKNTPDTAALATLSLFHSAVLGVLAHHRAARLWRDRHNDAPGGMLPQELCEQIPLSVDALRRPASATL
jgi:hydroxyethylthiazole kinase-like uncharacterized protein yjeF